MHDVSSTVSWVPDEAGLLRGSWLTKNPTKSHTHSSSGSVDRTKQTLSLFGIFIAKPLFENERFDLPSWTSQGFEFPTQWKRGQFLYPNQRIRELGPWQVLRQNGRRVSLPKPPFRRDKQRDLPFTVQRLFNLSTRFRLAIMSQGETLHPFRLGLTQLDLEANRRHSASPCRTSSFTAHEHYR